MYLLKNMARAYVYHGDWVSDCPREGCGNVEHLFGRMNPRDPMSPRTVRHVVFHCTYCGMQAEIDWPTEGAMDAILAVLMLRPVPHNRNWYPKDHTTAVRFRVPHGQSVDDLKQENRDHGVGV